MKLPKNYKLEKNPNKVFSVRFRTPDNYVSKWYEKDTFNINLWNCCNGILISYSNSENIKRLNKLLKSKNLLISEINNPEIELGVLYCLTEFSNKILCHTSCYNELHFFIKKYIWFTDCIDFINNEESVVDIVFNDLDYQEE